MFLVVWCRKSIGLECFDVFVFKKKRLALLEMQFWESCSLFFLIQALACLGAIICHTRRLC